MMRRTKKDRYFAMYKGDNYVDGGTIVELARKYHRTIKQMIYLTYPTTHKRAKDNRLLLYEVKG